MLLHVCQGLWPEQQFLMGIKFLIKLVENNAATLEMSLVFDIRETFFKVVITVQIL